MCLCIFIKHCHYGYSLHELEVEWQIIEHYFTIGTPTKKARPVKIGTHNIQNLLNNLNAEKIPAHNLSQTLEDSHQLLYISYKGNS